MSINDPYSRTESDLKFENIEQRLENKLDRVLMAIEISNKDIAWLTRVTMGVLLLLLGILVTSAVKWMFH
jgi:hypothetical protein